MKSKILIICSLNALILVTTFNVVAYEVWKEKDSIPYFREGVYQGEFVSSTWKEYKLRISFKAISKKEYQDAQGKNVIKDCALRRENDYYLLEGVLSVDDIVFELSFDGLTKRKQTSGGYIYYDKNNNYIMPGYRINSEMHILNLSINYYDHWVPASYIWETSNI